MNDDILTFTVENRHFAIPLENIVRVINSIEVIPIPNINENVSGIVRIHSKVHPVYNLRKKFGLPEKEISVDDHFIITKTSRLYPVLVADKVINVNTYSKDDVTELDESYYDKKEIKGVVSLNKDITLIYDLESFLSSEETDILNERLSKIEN